MQPIQIITAPSILGLKPTGVEKLPGSLLSNGLVEKLNCSPDIINVETFNDQYSDERDDTTLCLNATLIQQFSKNLGAQIGQVVNAERFCLVLGGDCSILIGIFAELKTRGNYGLLFCDAHGDFYQPDKSVTGEVADMDLAILTGRGPDILSNINQNKPYVKDQQVIHIGQRDWEETRKYGSQDIRQTPISLFDYKFIQSNGIYVALEKISEKLNQIDAQGFWIHFDTDVLADYENPAVDYRLPGGLSFKECEQLLAALISTNRVIGMSVTIFNPNLDDKDHSISKRLTSLLAHSLK